MIVVMIVVVVVVVCGRIWTGGTLRGQRRLDADDKRLLLAALVYLVLEPVDERDEAVVCLERAHVQIGDEVDDAHGSRHEHDELLRVVVVIDHLEERLHDAALDERVAARVVRGQVVEEGEERRGELVRKGLLARVYQVVHTLAHQSGQQAVIAGRLRGLDDLGELVGLLQVNDGRERLERGGLDLGKGRQDGRGVLDDEHVDELLDEAVVEQIVGVLLDGARVDEYGERLEARLHEQLALLVVGERVS